MIHGTGTVQDLCIVDKVLKTSASNDSDFFFTMSSQRLRVPLYLTPSTKITSPSEVTGELPMKIPSFSDRNPKVWSAEVVILSCKYCCARAQRMVSVGGAMSSGSANLGGGEGMVGWHCCMKVCHIFGDL